MLRRYAGRISFMTIECCRACILLLRKEILYADNCDLLQSDRKYQKACNTDFAAIPGDSKDLKNIDEYREKDAELYFVGFWVDRGDCDEKTVELLSGLHGKKIALFGTCGMGNDPAYYQKVIDRVKTWIPEDNEYMDAFLCQGKMPIQVRRRYEEMAKSGQNTEQIQAMIRNFDRAMLHPDRVDEAAAADFAVQVWKRIGS